MSSFRLSTTRAVAVALAAPLLMSPALAAKSADFKASEIHPSVMAFNQSPKGNAVTMTYAYLPSDGFVAIFATDASGVRTGKALGHAALAKGDHRNVAVELTQAPKAGTTYVAALFHDADGDKKFDAAKDLQFRTPGDLASENTFEVIDGSS